MIIPKDATHVILESLMFYKKDTGRIWMVYSEGSWTLSEHINIDDFTFMEIDEWLDGATTASSNALYKRCTKGVWCRKYTNSSDWKLTHYDDLWIMRNASLIDRGKVPKGEYFPEPGDICTILQGDNIRNVGCFIGYNSNKDVVVEIGSMYLTLPIESVRFEELREVPRGALVKGWIDSKTCVIGKYDRFNKNSGVHYVQVSPGSNYPVVKVVEVPKDLADRLGEL